MAQFHQFDELPLDLRRIICEFHPPVTGLSRIAVNIGPVKAQTLPLTEAGRSFMLTYSPLLILGLAGAESLPEYGVFPTKIAIKRCATLHAATCLKLEPDSASCNGEILNRVMTLHILRSTCRDAQVEVDRRFPDSLDCDRGKIRFNGTHDLVLVNVFSDIDPWSVYNAFRDPRLGPRNTFFQDVRTFYHTTLSSPSPKTPPKIYSGTLKV